MSTERKNNSSQFTRGTSGNPSGRPPGSRNHATLLMEALLEGEAHELTRKAIDLAKAGDTHALRLCLDRLMPPGKDRLVHFDLPPIRGLDDVTLVMVSILAAISEGKITPQEGEVISRILAEHAKVMTTQDVERRLQKLEQGSANEDDVTIVGN
jgi:Family of unknown function (DUF5681)